MQELIARLGFIPHRPSVEPPPFVTGVHLRQRRHLDLCGAKVCWLLVECAWPREIAAEDLRAAEDWALAIGADLVRPKHRVLGRGFTGLIACRAPAISADAERLVAGSGKRGFCEIVLMGVRAGDEVKVNRNAPWGKWIGYKGLGIIAAVLRGDEAFVEPFARAGFWIFLVSVAALSAQIVLIVIAIFSLLDRFT